MKSYRWIAVPIIALTINGCISTQDVKDFVDSLTAQYNNSRVSTLSGAVETLNDPIDLPTQVTLPETYTPFSQETSTQLDGRLLASHCFQCHGTNGYTVNRWDSIAGERIQEFYEDHPLMAAQAKGYTAQEVRAIFDYLATFTKYDDDRYDDDDRITNPANPYNDNDDDDLYENGERDYDEDDYYDDDRYDQYYNDKYDD